MGFSGYFLVVWDFIRVRAATGASRWGRAAARRPAPWSPTASASPTSTRSATGCSSSDSSTPSGSRCPTWTSTSPTTGATRSSATSSSATARDRVAHIITFGDDGGQGGHPRRRRASSASPSARPTGSRSSCPTSRSTSRWTRRSRRPRRSPSRSSATREVGELWQVASALEGCTRHASVSTPPRWSSPTSRSWSTCRSTRTPSGPSSSPVRRWGPSRSSGLLKMDFLGLRTLTVIANAVRLIKECQGTPARPGARCRSTTRGPTSSSPRPGPSACSSWSRRACGTRSGSLKPQRHRGHHRHGGAVPARARWS